VNELRHQAIAASAGSGKTFQLAHRYIRLLSKNVAPERIAALTFSRKAAGEIFESIVRYLCRAAADAEEAARTAARIGDPTLGPADFRGYLRAVLDSLHRLQVGTLDSFTIRILRSFPFELGLDAEFTVMDGDGAEAAAARDQVLEGILDRRRGDRAAQDAFLEAFKLATFGQEGKELRRALHEFVRAYHTLLLWAPEAGRWGHAPAIWPDRSPWLGPADDADQAARTLDAWIGTRDWPAPVAGKWREYIETARQFDTGSEWSNALDYMLERLLPVVDDLLRGEAMVKLYRTECRLGPEACRAAYALVHRVMAVELATAIRRTQGIHRVLTHYERNYNDTVRRLGRLTFDDTQLLLTPASPLGGRGGLTRRRDHPDRLFIDDRLDAQLDHWLLDEFQDTSDLQWAVLEGLVDEVLQDPEGRRTLFYVGDAKQAIYGWRGGNAALFQRILDRYGSTIDRVSLATSYRSCAPVIAAVNRVFDGLETDQLPEGGLSSWRAIWVPHRAEPGAVPGRGLCALVEPPTAGGAGKPGAEDRHAVAAAILREIDPVRRGLTAAALVRTNDQVRAVVDALRTACPGMPVSQEGKASITDNPVVGVLLALVRFAWHPGDAFSWRHLEMSPLKKWLLRYPSRHALAYALLDRIGRHGFRDFLHAWGRRLAEAAPLDAFGRKRWTALLDAAGEYDETGDRDGDRFLDFVDGYALHEAAAEQAVRVMTIHQAKGLGFDVVILPELQSTSLTGGQVDCLAPPAAVGTGPAWVLSPPRRQVMRHDQVLGAALQQADDADCLEALCVLYVAMTRARHALYLVTSFPGKTATAFTYAALLKQQLLPAQSGGDPIVLDGIPVDRLYMEGDWDWYREASPAADVPAPPAVAVAPAPETTPVFRPLRPRLAPVTPSGAEAHREDAGSLFAEDLHRILDLGTAVHALFERVNWTEETQPEQLAATWRAEAPGDPHAHAEAERQFLQAMQAPEVRQALSRPAGTAELWRERRFEVVLGGDWVSGAFDRVVVERDDAGAPARVTVIDYKSNQVSTEEQVQAAAAGYAAQMNLYRRTLAVMFRMDPARIRCRLVFTRPGRVVDL
jgi:ATP-dependent helicase/nuclease subunit A